MLERQHKHRKVVAWESPEEWDLEQRAFHANEEWDFEDLRDLISELWFQYCEAKRLEIYIDDIKIAFDNDSTVDVLAAARQILNEKEKLYELRS